MSIQEKFTEYEVWHDEYRCSDSKAYVHGILLIPTNKKKKLIEILKKLRKTFNYKLYKKKGFSGSLKTKAKSEFLRNKLLVAVSALNSKDNYEIKLYKVNNKARWERKYIPFLEEYGDDPFGARFGMLVVPNNHKDMLSMDYSRKVELTLRFCLKGVCHWSFGPEKPIKIKEIYFDGNEHHGQNYYIDHIMGMNDWREYIEINPAEINIDDRQRDQRSDETALIIDFVDAIVGSLYNKTYSFRKDKCGALNPLDDIIERLETGKIQKNKNGRWYKAISVSEVYLTGSEEHPFEFRPFEFQKNSNQLALEI
jgi:hypothetical protein